MPQPISIEFSQNHSCEPNCNINAVFLNDGGIDKPLLAVFTDREVEPWEELCFSYFSPDDGSNETETRSDLPIHSKCYCGTPSCRGYMFI
jgi:[histone H3]-lysine9 N-trimethyltransferase SUV39H